MNIHCSEEGIYFVIELAQEYKFTMRRINEMKSTTYLKSINNSHINNGSFVFWIQHLRRCNWSEVMVLLGSIKNGFTIALLQSFDSNKRNSNNTLNKTLKQKH